MTQGRTVEERNPRLHFCEKVNTHFLDILLIWRTYILSLFLSLSLSLSHTHTHTHTHTHVQFTRNLRVISQLIHAGEYIKKVKRTHLVKKFSTFCGISVLINAFTTHCSRFAIKHSCALLIYPIPGVSHVPSSPISFFFIFYGAIVPSWQAYPHYRSFTITLRHNTLGRTLDGYLARSTDLYLTTYKTRKRQKSMYSRGCESSVPRSVTRTTPEIARPLGSAPQNRTLWFYCGVSFK
jgi:hypothetical protein